MYCVLHILFPYQLLNEEKLWMLQGQKDTRPLRMRPVNEL